MKPPAPISRSRLAALIIIAAAVVGFGTNNLLKNQHRCFEERFTQSTPEPRSVELQPFASHTVFVWAVDEETGFEWADLDAHITLRAADGPLLVARRIAASESGEADGLKRAQNGFTERLTPGPAGITLSIDLENGDYVDIEIYQDLPAWYHIAPGVYILLGLFGLGLLLKSRQPVAA